MKAFRIHESAKTGGTITPYAPNICKTPAGGTPVAIPYPNVANIIDAQADAGNPAAKRKQAAIKKATGSSSATAGAIKMLNGNETGVSIGIISSSVMGKAQWIMYSSDVKFEGKKAVIVGNPSIANRS